MTSPFAPLDWTVVALYLALLAATGWASSRRAARSAGDYFLAGRSVPAWLAAISVLATTQSAATFLGAPDNSFRGDLSYLGVVLASIAAALVVAHMLIPRFYAMRVSTVYELLEARFDRRAMRSAGAMFLIGRVFSDGARVYLAGIALSMIAFSRIDAASVLLACAGLVAASLVFTFRGGLKSVIWNDFVQFVIYAGSAVAVLVFLRASIPLDTGDLVAALRTAPGGVDKLRLFDVSTDLARPFTVLAMISGLLLLNIANAGLDQDTTQRLLASPDARTGARGLILSALVSVPVIAVFVAIGLLLHIYYERPDLMGVDRAAASSFAGEKVTIFMHYILTQLPAGLRGLVSVGVAAAAVSTVTSSLNSLSSVLVSDFYRPWREKRGAVPDRHFVMAGRWGMAGFALALFAAASVSLVWQRHSDMPLLEFALQVMIFAYAGLLGVYFVALFTRRGTAPSAIGGMIGGFATVLLLQPFLLGPGGFAFPYQLVIGTIVSAAITAIPRGKHVTAARARD
ncbi:sodium:solute symporter [Sphingomonas sp.]|uniref:sodium:solute symporter family transporter n=1 Tax=Sphingomonas sp. TaxID=28214 RepID=UPI001EB277B8|nr:sodium:solute symporter [Sphingomonas sp.]MBX3595260.1 sodium:solute symporter [Sphingomonas sp.]